jgi:hypothetical protein
VRQGVLPLLEHLTRVGKRAYLNDMDPGGLRPRHLIALRLLAERGPQSQQGLAEPLNLDPSNVVGLLNELEERCCGARSAPSRPPVSFPRRTDRRPGPAGRRPHSRHHRPCSASSASISPTHPAGCHTVVRSGRAGRRRHPRPRWEGDRHQRIRGDDGRRATHRRRRGVAVGTGRRARLLRWDPAAELLSGHVGTGRGRRRHPPQGPLRMMQTAARVTAKHDTGGSPIAMGSGCPSPTPQLANYRTAKAGVLFSRSPRPPRWTWPARASGRRHRCPGGHEHQRLADEFKQRPPSTGVGQASAANSASSGSWRSLSHASTTRFCETSVTGTWTTSGRM